MFPQHALFHPAEAWSKVTAELPMIALLAGYRDAGSTLFQANESLMDQDEGELVARFHAYELLDYRARRPRVQVADHTVVKFRQPALDLRLMRDSLGQEFLLLHGYEPDFKWEEFAAAVLQITRHFNISSFTWAHAIPMPVPHTRPIRLALTGNREDLIERMSMWQSDVEAPAHALHLVEFELTRASVPVVDLVVLVPHYLAEGSVPAAALSLLEAIGTASGRMIETEPLRERGRTFRAEVDAQIQDNEEAQRMIGLLESQYDGFVRGTPQENLFADADGELPSADAIAAELERYLKARKDRD